MKIWYWELLTGFLFIRGISVRFVFLRNRLLEKSLEILGELHGRIIITFFVFFSSVVLEWFLPESLHWQCVDEFILELSEDTIQHLDFFFRDLFRSFWQIVSKYLYGFLEATLISSKKAPESKQSGRVLQDMSNVWHVYQDSSILFRLGGLLWTRESRMQSYFMDLLSHIRLEILNRCFHKLWFFVFFLLKFVSVFSRNISTKHNKDQLF